METNQSKNIIPVILSGGAGSRLWPLSRKLLPKQFLALADENHTLLQDTVLRLEAMMQECLVDQPIIVCNEEHRFLVAEQMREIGITNSRILLEPEGKNTAPAVALAAHLIEDKESILAVFPADHQIKSSAELKTALLNAANFAQQGYLATFGIVPQKPETGYGYIKSGKQLDSQNVFEVAQFVEKPDSETAQQFLKQGGYFWNSGMFVFSAATFLAELQTHAPAMNSAVVDSLSSAQKDLDFIRPNKDLFAQVPSDSIDYAVMEHTKKAIVVPIECAWTDLGSWQSLWEAQDKDKSGNVFIGDVVSHETKNSIIHSQKRLVATVGMEDCVIVDTEDAVLVAHKEQTQDVKEIVNRLTSAKREEVEYHRRVYRPWGYYENLIEAELYKVKRIMVHPGASLSLQLHYKRSEHWVVVRGVAEVVNGDKILQLTPNQSTYIPIETKHRLTNIGQEDLFLIEVQCGEYLGEDDIVRYQDTYGRVSAN